MWEQRRARGGDAPRFMEVCVCGVSHGPKQGGILACEAGEEPDYRAEDGAGKVTDILQERRGLPS